MKLAQIQMRVGPDKAANLRHAEALLAQGLIPVLADQS